MVSLAQAHGLAANLIVQLKQAPDFRTMPDIEFEAFLKESRLSERQRSELRKASDRQEYYRDARSWIEMNDAQSAHVEFHNYLIEHRIFMTDEFRLSFVAVDTSIGEALVEHRNWKEGAGREYLTSSVTKITHLSDKITEVERAVQRRLHYDSA